MNNLNGSETNEGFLPDRDRKVGESALGTNPGELTRRQLLKGTIIGAIAGFLGGIGLLRSPLAEPPAKTSPTPGSSGPDLSLGSVSPEVRATETALRGKNLHAGDPNSNPINKAAIENLGQSAPSPIPISTPHASK